MTPVLGLHIAAGLVALAAGAGAAAACKGGALHARAGTAFVVAMLVLGVSASVIDVLKGKSGFDGIFVVYFVTTAWLAARRRDGRTGGYEIAAGLIAIAFAALTFWGAATAGSTTPVGQGPVYVLGGLILLAGLLDLRVAFRRQLTPVQRLSRHLWRMLFGFFIATGSFFLGQQQVFPAGLRGSPVLLVLAFAPFLLMAYWLVRVRLGKWLRATIQALRAPSTPQAQA
ncbi:MAG TPA: hypothetical protein VEA79_08190 [Phenylobacterium sp.]|nr:hypothetical protein [Phenylobacterium sp.]